MGNQVKVPGSGLGEVQTYPCCAGNPCPAPWAGRHRAEDFLGILVALRKSPSSYYNPKMSRHHTWCSPPTNESRRICLRIWVSHLQEMSGQHTERDHCMWKKWAVLSCLERAALIIWAPELIILIIDQLMGSLSCARANRGLLCDNLCAGHFLAVKWTVPSPRETLVLDPEC